MIGALWLIIRRDWGLHRLRLALTVAGIALGVAVFFAVRTNNAALSGSLRGTIEKLGGRATLQVTAGESGFPIGVADSVRAVPGVEMAEPVTETVATLAGSDDRLMILGLDTSSDLKLYTGIIDDGGSAVGNPLAFASRADSIAVTRAFAERHSLRNGDKIEVYVREGARSLTIRAIFGEAGVSGIYGGNVAVMDIFAAQDIFGRGDLIDRVDVLNADGTDVGVLQSRIDQALPDGISAMRPSLRGQSLENSMSSISYGLTIMSFLALTISGFIIYNSFSISVAQRWREIGILRAVGLDRHRLRLMFLSEAVVFGLVGAVAGIVLGLLLAKLSLRFTGNVAASFYGIVPEPGSAGFDWRLALEAFAAGTAASIIAAWVPARAAANVEPVRALRNVETAEKIAGTTRLRSAAGFLMVVSGLGLTRFVPPDIGSNFQMLFAFIIQIGMFLLIPLILKAAGIPLRRLFGTLFGSEGLIAVDTMLRAPRRTTSTVAAIMIGFSFVVSTSSFVGSQRDAIIRSIDRVVAADVLVMSSTEVRSKTYHIASATADAIRGLRGVETVDAVRITSLGYDGQEIALMAHEMSALFRISPDLLDAGDPRRAARLTAEGTGILVSTNFANRWKLGIGDTVTIEAPDGPLRFEIAGILDYYRSEAGTVFFDREVYRRHWRDSDVDYIYVDAAPGTDIDILKTQISAVLGPSHRGFIFAHEEYRKWVGTIVDRFFALMYVQMVIAAFVAGLGLVNTMVISVSERRREIGIFRALGGLRHQVAKMIVIEAVAVGLVGFLAGSLSGIFNAYYLVTGAARIIAGYTLPLDIPSWTMAAALPAVVLLAIVSAIVPALEASRANVAEAIGYE